MEKPSEKNEVYNLLCDLLKGRFAGKSGIIYTFSIKDAEDLAGELITRGKLWFVVDSREIKMLSLRKFRKIDFILQ